MNYSECNSLLDNLEQQIVELENLVFEGNFSENELTKMFKNNTANIRKNGIAILYQTVKDIGEKVNGLIELEKIFPNEPRITKVKNRFAYCGQHFVTMINLMETWD